MSTPRRERIAELFDLVVDQPASEQRGILEAACDGDGELLQETLRLLEADRAEHPLLQRSIGNLAAELMDFGNGQLIPGRFGKYAIREYLGEGGMGLVYAAVRDDLGDRVAIKFLHDPGSSPAKRERFVREQQTLAALNHPNIARLYDAGVENGVPWFAMEYVDGVAITEYCRVNRVGLRQRLEVYQAACEAVSYAHRNLTIHLDLKPSNILVNREGQVKLLDFGIARNLEAQGGLAERTKTGLRLLSLNYAAPEQIRGQPLGVQTDVHALGVVLYELLTGNPPADLANASAAELMRVLDEEPRRPSAVARDVDSIAFHASKAVWNDLDVLCLTALHRDRDRRYGSAGAIARDVGHFLKDEPLEAHPDTVRYRSTKFITRHRRSVTAAAAVLAAVSAIVVFFTIRLVEARDRAVSSEARTQRIYHLMLNLFEGDDSAAGPAEGLRVVSLLDRGVREAETLDQEPALQAELRYTFGGLYHKLGRLDRAEPLLFSAWKAQRSALGPDHPETMRDELALALLRVDQSQLDEAERLVQEALRTAKAHYPASSFETASATAALGKVLATRGDYKNAVPLLEQAVSVLGTGPGSVELSEALGDLANTYYYLGRIDASEAVNLRGIAHDRKLFGNRHPHVAVGLYNLGNIQLDRGDYKKAEELFRDALAINEAWYGPVHPKTASDRLMLGRAIEYQGQLDEASTMFAQALAAYRTAYGEGHPRIAVVESLMGDLAMKRRQRKIAEKLFRSAAAIFKTAFGEHHEFYLHQLSNLGSVNLAQKKPVEAESLLRRAVEGLRAAVPAQRYTGMAELRLGEALAAQNRLSEAEHHGFAGYLILRKLMGPRAAELQDARKELVTIYLALNQPAKAKEFRAEFERQDGAGVSGRNASK